MSEFVKTLGIHLNGNFREIPPGSTLLDLLEALGRDSRTVAMELNGEILRRARYGERELLAGDRVEIVHFVQGG